MGLTPHARRILLQAYEEYPDTLNEAECGLPAQVAEVDEDDVD